MVAEWAGGLCPGLTGPQRRGTGSLEAAEGEAGVGMGPWDRKDRGLRAGIEPRSSTLQENSLPSEPPGKSLKKPTSV